MRMQPNRPPDRSELGKSIGLFILLLLAALLQRWQGPGMSPRPTELPANGAITGHPRLVDGDSFFMDGDEVRMVGIDAPEGRQSCTREGREWACGEASRTELARLIGGQEVTCSADERDQHQRLLARCRAGGVDLNRQMVANGFAVSFGRQYQREEDEARLQRRGIWASEFDRPQEWRHAHGIGGSN